jgi:hypothetical protein
MSRLFSLALAVILGMISGAAPPRDMDDPNPEPVTPPHLRGQPSSLYMRVKDNIVEAPPELLKLAQTYASMPGKGQSVKGRRITILAEKSRYKVGEPVRILHVLEATGRGVKVYAMGPKPVYDEYVDGKNRRPKPAGAEEVVYDGLVETAPAVDFHYDITSYTFRKPGQHTIQWKGGGHPIEGGRFGLESNVLTITVVE